MSTADEQREIRRQNRMNRRIARTKNYFDYSLLFIVIFLVCFGLVMIYSTSWYSASQENGNPLYYLQRQGIFAAFGMFMIFVITRFDYHFWTRFAFLAYIVAIVLQVLVLIPGIGIDANGSRRWLGIKNVFTFQPSEISKLVLVLMLAFVASKSVNELKTFLGIVKVMALAMPIVILVAINNLSTAIVLVGITFMIVFVGSNKYRPFVIMLIGVGVFGVVGIMAASYRADRITAWLNVETADNAYQIRQALYAIGSGGLFGKGLGQSIQKLDYVPEAHNDMIFSIICEELGLFGGIAVILLFVLLLWRCMVIANNAPDLFGALLVVGVMAQIGLQVLINVAVATNSIPNTGIPLPFISYGGTSVTFLLCEIGLVLSVSKQIKFNTDTEKSAEKKTSNPKAQKDMV